ncbi:hypothetical protein ACFSJQ_06075 [Vibrio olivae]
MERGWNDFISLYGNIEGARSAFEKVCGSLLRAEYPSQAFEVKAYRGDDGIDIFVGSDIKSESLEVFQCKFFVNDFSYSQHSQINKSFDKIMSNESYNCRKWHLLLPRTLTTDEHKWYSDWKAKKKKIKQYKLDPENVVLWDGDKIIDHLKNCELYNRWFKIEDSLKIEAIHSAIMGDSGGLDVPGEKEIRELDNYLYKTSSFIPSEMRMDFAKILAELAQNAHQHGDSQSVSVCSNGSVVKFKYDGREFNPLEFDVKPYHGMGIRSTKGFLDIYSDSVSCKYSLDEYGVNIVSFVFSSGLNPHQTENPCYIFASHSISSSSLYPDINRAIDFNCNIVEIDLVRTIMHFSNLSILINECVKRTRAYGTKFKFIVSGSSLTKRMISSLHMRQAFSQEDLERIEWEYK